ncbi:hypothetical protein BSR28_06120 [Boudabousia liubingyangii]|uniref:Panacea domain-containing protein n=1 Tax=Boudabousia liubingyangii TaxID=1921764 RepID=UPI000939EE17|nr:type II toxin-antitoxin system antitoxin SocA domain-containing protein [Boudabousia liubingyangii]OKL46993.1 hypothetical protein BSR28_06120 [Boudabousia liubingyangii]
MADIFDVSKAVLSHYRNGISTQKLQKLNFFAQGWVLALTGQPLFKEDFEAWQFGPVNMELYQYHRGCYSVSSSMLTRGNAENLTATESAILRAVINNYGSLSGDELSEITHIQGSPWSDVRARENLTSEQTSRKVIPKESIRIYFQKILGIPV